MYLVLISFTYQHYLLEYLIYHPDYVQSKMHIYMKTITKKKQNQNVLRPKYSTIVTESGKFEKLSSKKKALLLNFSILVTIFLK